MPRGRRVFKEIQARIQSSAQRKMDGGSNRATSSSKCRFGPHPLHVEPPTAMPAYRAASLSGSALPDETGSTEADLAQSKVEGLR